MNVLVLFGSTRTERKGEVVFDWVKQQLEDQNNFSTDAVDLRDIQLPFYDEVKSVGGIEYDNYTHAEGAAWGKRVESADAFIIITPEYNHGTSAVLKNAIDYAWQGWNYKPVSFISYSSGTVAGARATEQLRLIASGVKLLPLPTAVHIPNLADSFDESGQPTTEKIPGALNSLITELADIGGKLTR